MADGGDVDNKDDINPRVKSARTVQEVFHGRLTEEEASKLLDQHEWEEINTIDFILQAQPDEVRNALGNDGRNVLGVRKDEVLRELARKHAIGTEVRQFGCTDCDNGWWRKVPVRKMVSKCRMCKRRFDAIPRDREYGWALFECQCGNEFSGFGQMGKTSSKSRCYKCQTLCQPVKINPPSRRQGRTRRSNASHSCTADNCFRQEDAAFGYGGGQGGPYIPKGGYYREPGGNRREQAKPKGDCVHPKSTSKRVIEGSMLHASTGSTVMTFLSQDDLETSYNPDLSDVDEGSEGVE